MCERWKSMAPSKRILTGRQLRYRVRMVSLWLRIDPALAGAAGLLPARQDVVCSVEPLSAPLPEQLTPDTRLVLIAEGHSLREEQRGIILLTDHLGFFALPCPSVFQGFPSMAEPYDAGLRAELRAAAAQCGLTCRDGVGAWLACPALLTEAERAVLRREAVDVALDGRADVVVQARSRGMSVAIACFSRDTVQQLHTWLVALAERSW